VVYYFLLQNLNFLKPTVNTSQDGAVSIVTQYGLEQSRDQITVAARLSASVQTGPGAHLASCTMGIRYLSRGVKRLGYGVARAHIVLKLKKVYSYTSTTPMGSTYII